jgi:hypothetical protein
VSESLPLGAFPVAAGAPEAHTAAARQAVIDTGRPAPASAGGFGVRTGPTWLTFVILGLASFAPIVLGLRPGRWMVSYYGVLFVGWAWTSIARVRGEARDDRWAERPRGTRRGPARGAGSATAVTRATASARRPSGRRLIVVARDAGSVYDRLRRAGVAHAVTIITDRRSIERRLQLQVYIPDRRRGERRRHDTESLLRAEGWAEVTLPQR